MGLLLSKTKKEETFGDYRITRNESTHRETLVQDYGDPKTGYKTAKVFEMPVDRLTPDQRDAWLASVSQGTPRNPFTGRSLRMDGPTAAMLTMLAKRTM
jgi:hypothetical protein